MRTFLILCCALCLSAAELTLSEAWSRATVPAAQTGAVFATFTNPGKEAVSIVGASSSSCERVELHTHIAAADGSARMEPVEAIEVPAGGQAVLKPGGLHIMLIGLKSPLVEGGFVNVVLKLSNNTSMTINAQIGPITASCAGCLTE